MISSEVGRIRDLTKSFLQFASLENPNLQTVNIKDVIEQSLLQFKTYFNNGIKLEISFHSDNDTIIADPQQLQQLFHIIFENAIDSMGIDGIIEVKTLKRSVSKVVQEIDVEITDNGLGISTEDMNKIFEPYFSSKKDGNGMGLAIAKKIVEDNGGTIKLYSREGLGTTVTISFKIGQ
jgi:nitrogen fixation/metabolism regulation signal transduction histidine kinase